MPIDHVLIAVEDFREAADRLRREHGLGAIEGGRHPAWGTANWIVPLGSSYLELVGVVDRTVAEATTFGRRTLGALASGGGPYAWCVAPDDFDGTLARLGLSPASGSRRLPDGSALAWRTAGLEIGLADPSRPFFIRWDVPAALHPGRSIAEHETMPAGIDTIEIEGDERHVRAWLGDEGGLARVAPGEPRIRSIGIRTVAGTIVLPGAPHAS